MTNNKKILIGILTEDSDQEQASGKNVADVLNNHGIASKLIDIYETDLFKELSNIRAAIITFHKHNQHTDSIFGILDYLGIPIIGSNSLTNMLCKNRLVTRQLFSYHNVPVLKYKTIYLSEEIPVQIQQIKRGRNKIASPFMIRPLDRAIQDESIIAHNHSALFDILNSIKKHIGQVIIEQHISSPTYICFVLNLDGETTPLPVLEINDVEAQLFFYGTSMHSSHDVKKALLPQSIVKKTQEIAVQAHIALGFQGASQTVILVDHLGRTFALETETFIDYSKDGLLHKAALFNHISYDNLILNLFSF